MDVTDLGRPGLRRVLSYDDAVACDEVAARENR